MFYAFVFHFLAGAVTGIVFKVRTLLILLGLVLIASVVLAFAHGGVAGLWILANLVGIQVGYLGGIYFRGICEHAGYLLPTINTRRSP